MKKLDIIRRPRLLAQILLNRIAPFIKSDKLFLQMKWVLCMNYPLNLNNPRTYNEKLQWLKLYNHNPIYHVMVDKFEVKKYVSNCIGNEYIIPTIGIWETPEEICLESLPDKFVLKCTHDSGGVFICEDKTSFDISRTKRMLKKGLRESYYYRNREWPYLGVKPRIIAEVFMKDKNTNSLNDYKVMCFNGKAKLIELHQGRNTKNHTQDFYDRNWNKTSITQGSYGIVSPGLAERPVCLDEMLELSEKLASGIPHVRVDWYIVDGNLYFGELTFFDGSGLTPWDKYEDDLLMGSWITLPENTFEKKTSNGFGNEGIDMFY